MSSANEMPTIDELLARPKENYDKLRDVHMYYVWLHYKKFPKPMGSRIERFSEKNWRNVFIAIIVQLKMLNVKFEDHFIFNHSTRALEFLDQGFKRTLQLAAGA